MPTLSAAETTPEEVYELLKSLNADGLIRYILPTTPLGEEWVLGTDDDQLLKLNHEQVVAFLIGNQMTLHWLMARLQEHGVAAPAWMTPKPSPWVAVLVHDRMTPPDVMGPFETEDEARRWIAWHRRPDQLWDAQEVVPA